MAKQRYRRQAVTSKGVGKRLESADFERVSDPRRTASVKHPLTQMLRLIVVALMSRCWSQRALEDASEELRLQGKGLIDLDERLADNVFGMVLQRLAPPDLRACLHRLVKGEIQRKTFEGTRTLPFGVVAIDGKALATLREHDLRRLFPAEVLASDEALRVAMAAKYPSLRLQVGEHGRTASTLMHRTTLVSSTAAPAIDEVAVPAGSNEVGQLVHTLRELHRVYGRTTLFEMVIADAGNCSLAAADWCDEVGYHYMLRIKSNQPDLLHEAKRRLGGGGKDSDVSPRPDHEREMPPYRGSSVRYRVWTCPTSRGFLRWRHLQQLVRVERIIEREVDGQIQQTVGERYFVTSMRPSRMCATTALDTVRSYWRCENEQHWTADTVWSEDARQAPMSRHPDGMKVASLLRLIAMAIASILRSKCRIDRKGTRPSWRKVAACVYAAFFEPKLPAEGVAAFE